MYEGLIQNKLQCVFIVMKEEVPQCVWLIDVFDRQHWSSEVQRD